MIMKCLYVARHTQSTQNNRFTISLQYLKENVIDEVAFFPGDDRQSFLQIDTITLGACGQVCPKQQISYFFPNILRKKGVRKLIYRYT